MVFAQSCSPRARLRGQINASLDTALGRPTEATVHATHGAREQRRRLRRRDRRSARAAIFRRKGQTLIIFALSVTVLLGIAGLVIDVARAYDLYARMQRAADAGAIAGVLYVPKHYNSARTPGDGQSAVSRATAEILKDGFGTAAAPVPATNPCPTPYSSVEIAVCQVPNESNDLEVIITERLDVTLLGELGVTPITLQAHSQAEYMVPIQIGSRENYFGDEAECSSGNSSNTNTTSCTPGDSTQNHLQYFMASLNGPAELKESGDPFVYCGEGNANVAPDPNSSLTTYNGQPTDHPQWSGVPTGTTYTGGISQYCGQPVPGGNPGNPDFQPNGWDGTATAGTAHDGGDNYYIELGQSVPTSTLWIYNPFFIPQDSNASPAPLDYFYDHGTNPLSPNYYQGPLGEGIGANFDGSHRDAPFFYFSVTYSLYSINNLYDRSTDNLVASETFSPYDNTSADLAYHGCTAGSQVYNPYWNGKGTTNFYHKPTQVVAGQGCVSTSLPGLCSYSVSTPGWCELQNCGVGLDPTSNPENVTPTSTTPTPCLGQATLNASSAYRLVVEATGLNAGCVLNSNGVNCDYSSTLQDGFGHHSYSLKLCASTTLTNPINCSNGDGSNGAGGFNNSQVNIYGWNNNVLTFLEPLGTQSPNPNYPQTSCVTSAGDPYACFDLGCIPTSYAGRTVTLGLYDPGDGPGKLYIGVTQPPGSSSTVTIKYPSYTTPVSLDGDTVVQTSTGSGGYRPFHGVWLDVVLQLGSSYQGDCFSTGAKSGKSGWFQVVYISDTDSLGPQDTLGMEFNLIGSPVHLVPPVLY